MATNPNPMPQVPVAPAAQPAPAAPDNAQLIAALASVIRQAQPYAQPDPRQAPQPQFQPQPPAAAPQFQPQPVVAPQPQFAPQAPQQPQPLQVTLPNGQVIQAATPEELSRQVSFILSQYQRDQQVQQQRTAAPETPGWKNPTMQEKEEFARTFLDNPYEAIHYALKQITGWDDPGTVLNETVKATEEEREARAIQGFLFSTPDYFPGPHNVAILDGIMQRNGWTATTESLTAAWNLAKAYGMAQVRQMQPQVPQPGVPPQMAPQFPQQPQFQAPQFPQNPYQVPQQPGYYPPQIPAAAFAPGVAPPAVPRAAGVDNAEADAMAMFEDLPLDQMRAVLQRAAPQQ